MIKLTDLFRTSKKKEEPKYEYKTTEYHQLEDLLDNIDHDELGYVESGGSHLDSNDDQCIVFNELKNKNKDTDN